MERQEAIKHAPARLPRFLKPQGPLILYDPRSERLTYQLQWLILLQRLSLD